MEKTFKKGRYEQIGPMHTAAGGQWCFAKDRLTGAEVFLKEYPSLRYPSEDADTSHPGVRSQIDKCDAYVARVKEINSRVNSIAGNDGNVVITTDFFREGVFLYKVTRKVNMEAWDAQEVHRRLKPEQIDLLMIDLLNAVSTLHAAGVLHCDLKPENVFIVRRDGRYTAMIADYDDSFLMSDVPSGDKIVGTPEYFSPELGLYVVSAQECDEPPVPLRAASDIFALGLVYHQYLTGALPAFPDAYPQLWAALLSGEKIRLGKKLAPERREIIASMLSIEPDERPGSCMRVVGMIKNMRREMEAAKAAAPAPAPRKGTPRKTAASGVQTPGVLLDKAFDPPYCGLITRVVRYNDGSVDMAFVDGQVSRISAVSLPLYGLGEYM